MKIIVTDLTRFRDPTIVCLAGIEPVTGQCIRPMLLRQQTYKYLSFDAVKEKKVMPGSWLEGDFAKISNLKAPHLEDHSVIGNLRQHGASSGSDFERVLDNSSVSTVQAGFGTRPDNRLYARETPPACSIMTLKLSFPRTQFKLTVDTGFGAIKFKAHITDASGYELSFLPVTDLGFSDHLKQIRVTDPTLNGLNSFLHGQKTLYIRLGLTRPYAPKPERDGYWVQINGIYSFPNYRKDLRIYD